jgi:hypothetical protein
VHTRILGLEHIEIGGAGDESGRTWMENKRTGVKKEMSSGGSSFAEAWKC